MPPPVGAVMAQSTEEATSPSSTVSTSSRLSNTTIYSITLVAVTVLSPILVTSLSRYLPRSFSTIKSCLGTPLLSRRQSESLAIRQTGSPPTTGVSLYILFIFSLTLFFTFFDHQYKSPHIFSPSLAERPFVTYVFQRTGVLAFAFLPVGILFSSRNNIFSLLVSFLPVRLGVETYSHATFIVLHRWLGRLCALLAIAHSILALPLYLGLEGQTHHTQAYWIWGSVAIIALGLLVIFGSLVFRRRWYEPFLIGHILLSVFILVGCWYHVAEWVDFRSGKGTYGAWILGAAAAWAFDRLVRLGRVVRNGLHRAKVTELGDNGEYLRLDFPSAKIPSRPGTHVYVHFLGMKWGRPWENHPFSVVPTALLASGHKCGPDDEQDEALGSGDCSSESGRSSLTLSADQQSPASTKSSDLDVEKCVRVTERRSEIPGCEQSKTGLTLLIKKSKGLTKHLKAQDRLLAVLDGPYPNNSATQILQCERLLLIGGGIGITGVLQWIVHHPNVKLAWSLKENASCLVKELAAALDKVCEKEIRIGSRLNIEQLLKEERNLGWSRVGVVVSGPGSLCDVIQRAVATVDQKATTMFELEVDAYS